MKLEHRSNELKLERPRRAVVSEKEALKRMREFYKRKEQFHDDRAKREAVKKRYGITAYRPRLAVIVGRSVSVDEVLYKQISSDLENIEVITTMTL